jgi:hypothetical protein
MVLLAEFNPMAVICPTVFLSMLAFVVWGMYYSARQRGEDALTVVSSMVGGVLGLAGAMGLMFALSSLGVIRGFAVGGFVGAVLGCAGAVWGASLGKSFAASRNAQAKDRK